MPIHIEFIEHGGQVRRTISATEGKSVMLAAVEADVQGIVADCGGVMSCATCHVIVPPEWSARLPPPSDDEGYMLEMTAAPREPGSRLSCQLKVTPEMDGLVLQLPSTQY